MANALLQFDRDFARTFMGGRGGQTVSDLVAKDISSATGMRQKDAKDAFHAVLIGGAIVGGGVALARWLSR